MRLCCALILRKAVGDLKQQTKLQRERQSGLSFEGECGLLIDLLGFLARNRL